MILAMTSSVAEKPVRRLDCWLSIHEKNINGKITNQTYDEGNRDYYVSSGWAQEPQERGCM